MINLKYTHNVFDVFSLSWKKCTWIYFMGMPEVKQYIALSFTVWSKSMKYHDIKSLIKYKASINRLFCVIFTLLILQFFLVHIRICILEFVFGINNTIHSFQCSTISIHASILYIFSTSCTTYRLSMFYLYRFGEK